MIAEFEKIITLHVMFLHEKRLPDDTKSYACCSCSCYAVVVVYIQIYDSSGIKEDNNPACYVSARKETIR